MTSKSELAVWLEFIRAFLWPATVLFTMLMFRRQIISLLDRASSLKVAGWELTAFQVPSSDAKVSPPAKQADIVNDGCETFLTETGIRAAIRDGGNLAAGDEIYRTMRIFSTAEQTTWLAFSKQKLFLLLDDASTRKSGRLIQWVLSREQATPIKARLRSRGVGLLDIGMRINWLYSTNLFATPEYLTTEIQNALDEGR